MLRALKPCYPLPRNIGWKPARKSGLYLTRVAITRIERLCEYWQAVLKHGGVTAMMAAGSCGSYGSEIATNGLETLMVTGSPRPG
jgi:hypothetical protein